VFGKTFDLFRQHAEEAADGLDTIFPKLSALTRQFTGASRTVDAASTAFGRLAPALSAVGAVAGAAAAEAPITAPEATVPAVSEGEQHRRQHWQRQRQRQRCRRRSLQQQQRRRG
jgi:hypothetical protein